MLKRKLKEANKSVSSLRNESMTIDDSRRKQDIFNSIDSTKSLHNESFHSRNNTLSSDRDSSKSPSITNY